MTEEEEKKNAAKRIIASMPADIVGNSSAMRVWFKKNILKSDKQWSIFDEMINQVFPRGGGGIIIRWHDGIPHIPSGVRVPAELYKNIIIQHGRNKGQVVRQAKCKINIAGKIYRKGMFIPIKR